MSNLHRTPQGLGQRPALMLVDLICGFTDPSSPLGSDSAAVVASYQRCAASLTSGTNMAAAMATPARAAAINPKTRP